MDLLILLLLMASSERLLKQIKAVQLLKESGRCADCGEAYPYYCMEYDHVRGSKSKNISQMYSHSWGSIEAEIAKCDLVCIMCHRNRTYIAARLKWERFVFSQEPDAVAARARVDAVRKTIQDAKNIPCTDCNKRYDHWLMDFDHRPGEAKAASVSSMITTQNIDRVNTEIAKCDVVCALCHRIRTRRRGWPVCSDTANPKELPTGKEPWRKNKRLSPFEESQVVQMYLDGLTQDRIAKGVGSSRGAVKGILKKHGVALRHGREVWGRYVKLTAEQEADVVKMYNEGCSSGVIANNMGVSTGAIFSCLKRFGISPSTAIPIIDQFGNMYKSTKDAANKLGLSHRCIAHVLRGETRSTKGYTFTYVNKRKNKNGEVGRR